MNSPSILCPHIGTASPAIDIGHQSGTFVTTDEPTVIQHHYQVMPVQFRSLSELHILGFKQMYNGVYSSLQCCTELFTVLKILGALPLHHSLPLNPATTNLFTIFTVLPFQECHSDSWNYTVYCLSDWLFSLSNRH